MLKSSHPAYQGEQLPYHHSKRYYRKRVKVETRGLATAWLGKRKDYFMEG
jgi:hypothetical protein